MLRPASAGQSTRYKMLWCALLIVVAIILTLMVRRALQENAKGNKFNKNFYNKIVSLIDAKKAEEEAARKAAEEEAARKAAEEEAARKAAEEEAARKAAEEAARKAAEEAARKAAEEEAARKAAEEAARKAAEEAARKAAEEAARQAATPQTSELIMKNSINQIFNILYPINSNINKLNSALGDIRNPRELEKIENIISIYSPINTNIKNAYKSAIYYKNSGQVDKVVEIANTIVYNYKNIVVPVPAEYAGY